MAGRAQATGNVGHKLSNYGDEINTYFSRDAGLVWYAPRTMRNVNVFIY